MGLRLGSLAYDTEDTTTSTATSLTTSSKITHFPGSCSSDESQFSEEASRISIDNSYPGRKILESPKLKEFSFTNLKTATKNFKPYRMLLSEGDFSKVFKGWVDEKTLAPSKAGTGMAVFIKKLDSTSLEGLQERQAKVNFLGKLSHPNLIRMLGYCWRDEVLHLVYEHMSMGSLEYHLFRTNTLSWDIRLKIVIGAARGLAFLHTSEKQITYRVFKASNILFDGNYNAKISNFGLETFEPFVKSDVYGFGVVLLEMLTSLRAFYTERPSGQQNLVEWLKPSLSSKRKLKCIMDIRMEGQYSTMAALRAGQLTRKCLDSNPRNRPDMKEVVEALEGIEAIKEKP